MTAPVFQVDSLVGLEVLHLFAALSSGISGAVPARNSRARCGDCGGDVSKLRYGVIEHLTPKPDPYGMTGYRWVLK